MTNSFQIVRSDRGGSDYWITVVQTPRAYDALNKALSDEEHERLVDELAMNPEAGDFIPNSNGLRKMRAACKGKGKSKGLRIVYLFYDLNMPLFILAAYEKSRKERYTESELAQMRALVQELVNEFSVKIRKLAGSAA